MAKHTPVLKVIPEETKTKAKELYVSGLSVKDIVHEIRKLTKEPFGSAALRNWIRAEDWDTLRQAATQMAIAKMADEISDDKVEVTKKQLKAYRKTWLRGEREVEIQNVMTALDAARMIELGIRGEREIQTGIVSVNFINDILVILSEEIKEPDVLTRIGLRLKKLAGELIERTTSSRETK